MNALLMRSRDLVWWIAPVFALLAVIGVMVESAHGQATTAPAETAPPKSVVPTLLPEYSIGGGPEARSETVNRTLFNPTRRPAPTPVQETPKPQMQRGQFVLTGTTVVEGKATAFLREVKTGKSRRVAQGDNVNGLTVAEVKPDRVKLTAGDESEDVSLKVAGNPRMTPGALVPPVSVTAAAPQASPGAPGMPGVGAPGNQVAQTPEQAAQMLLERRRAARAAAADPTGAAVAAPRGGAQPAPAANNAPQSAAPQGGSQSWADVFRRYQERGGVTPGR